MGHFSELAREAGALMGRALDKASALSPSRVSASGKRLLKSARLSVERARASRALSWSPGSSLSAIQIGEAMRGCLASQAGSATELSPRFQALSENLGALLLARDPALTHALTIAFESLDSPASVALGFHALGAASRLHLLRVGFQDFGLLQPPPETIEAWARGKAFTSELVALQAPLAKSWSRVDEAVGDVAPGRELLATGVAQTLSLTALMRPKQGAQESSFDAHPTDSDLLTALLSDPGAERFARALRAAAPSIDPSHRALGQEAFFKALDSRLLALDLKSDLAGPLPSNPRRVAL